MIDNEQSLAGNVRHSVLNTAGVSISPMTRSARHAAELRDPNRRRVPEHRATGGIVDLNRSSWAGEFCDDYDQFDWKKPGRD